MYQQSFAFMENISSMNLDKTGTKALYILKRKLHFYFLYL